MAARRVEPAHPRAEVAVRARRGSMDSRTCAKQPRPQRSSYDSVESYTIACQKHKEHMSFRRKAQERIREAARPHRDRTGRDQSGRAHHSRDKLRKQRREEKAELKARRNAAHSAAVDARIHERTAFRDAGIHQWANLDDFRDSTGSVRDDLSACEAAAKTRQRAWEKVKELRKRPKLREPCVAEVSFRVLPLV